jgi:hypothetical protein
MSRRLRLLPALISDMLVVHRTDPELDASAISIIHNITSDCRSPATRTGLPLTAVSRVPCDLAAVRVRAEPSQQSGDLTVEETAGSETRAERASGSEMARTRNRCR